MKNGEERLDHLRHSLAHLLAAAVLNLWPDAKRAIGPAIEHGFYYDFEFSKPIAETDLPKIEKAMRQILPTWTTFERFELKPNEAKREFAGNPYKHELIDEFSARGEKVTFYKSGDYWDLCRGGHVENMHSVDPNGFKLTRLAGAYWRGNEKNPQLTRIYGLAFPTAKELNSHLALLEEAAKRDHRKIGKELDLFSFHEEAPGAVFWHPNGMILWHELERLLRETLTKAGYQEVQTPLMVKPDLFTRSGHLAHYKANMFRVSNPQGEELYLKPMNCPEGAVIFSTTRRSYRDLPYRQSEIGRIHRNELSGTLGGLFRVRQITQDDGHIYCRLDQVEKEITNVLKLSKAIYKLFGLKPSFYLSTKPDDAMGDSAAWERAETALANALRANKIEYGIKEKEGTFYAPKIDIDITDSLGRRWQLCTIQADLVMVPSLPGVAYVDSNGKITQPIVIHRAIYGSFERFIGILVEHYGGNFPLWLSPVQIQIIPVANRHQKTCEKLAKEFREAGIRVSVDGAQETVGYKIRRAASLHVPHLLVMGDKEAKGTKLSVRARGSEKVKVVTKKSFLATLLHDIEIRR